MLQVKVTQIGNSTGLILPKEVVAQLNVRKGDSVYLTRTPDGYAIHTGDPEFAAQMEAAEEGMARYRNTLRKLAE